MDEYDSAMIATLLLLAGVTSSASIYYKNKTELLNKAEDTDKMYYTLKAIEHFSFWHDIKVMFMTVLAVCGKEYVGDYAKVEEEVAKV